MLAVLRKKNVYAKSHCRMFGRAGADAGAGAPSSFSAPAGSFDGVTICAGFGPGHLPAASLREAATLIRTGRARQNS